MMFEIKPREIIPIIKDIAVGGVAIKSAPPGGMVEIAQKMFTTSFDDNFETIANHLISLMLGGNRSNDINQLLALIKPDNKAYIYSDYPFGLTARCKRDVQGGTFVYERDIADIESVAFDMGDFVFDFQYGDKVVWLFRSNWKFGLYFDMTQESTKKDIYTDMGTAYKLLKYYDLYTFLEDEINFNQLICDGWFPFIELMGKEYKKLLSYYNEKEKFDFKVNNLLENYNKEKINHLTNKWWRNKIYDKKKEILEAGINSYLSDTKEGYINCIKNLSTELDGIMRLLYTDENESKPSTKEMKEFVIHKAKEKFSIYASLSFPDLFQTYLDEVLFKGFDIVKDEIPASRHTFAHGVAKDEQYTKEKAFQLILSLDQICYYF